MYYLDPQQFTLSAETIHNAIFILSTPSLSHQASQVTNYLGQCQKHLTYIPLLISIFQQSPAQLTKQYAFVFLANTIKNNWNSRNSNKRVDISSLKPSIKQTLLKYARQPLSTHPFPSLKKILSDIICKISQTDYPTNWEALHSMGLEVLGNVANSVSEEDIWFLSVWKQVWELRVGKCMNKEEEFNKYGVDIVKNGFDISVMITKELERADEGKMQTLLNLNKHVDGIVMNSLITMDKKLQNDHNLASIITAMISKLDTLYQLFTKLKQSTPQSPILPLLQQNINTILFSISNFQLSHPFTFRSFLPLYFSLIKTFLHKSKQFTDEHTHKIIITSLTHILKCVVYYFTPQKFQRSKFSPELRQLQPECYNHFVEFFSRENIGSVFNCLVLEILSMEAYNIKDSIDEEESEGNVEEESIYLLTCGLVKELMKRFKPVCLELINELLNNFLNFNQEIQQNIITILLVAPKIYEKDEMPINKIIKLLQYLSTQQSMYKQFALICNRYARFLAYIQGQSVLNILIHIITHSQDVQIIYESGLAIKKILSQQVILDLSNLHQIITIMLSLIYKIDDPTIRWYIVQLIGRIISQTQLSPQFIHKCLHLQQLHQLCKQKAEETLVYPTCDMLMKFLSKSTNTRLIQLIFIHIESKITGDLQNPEIIYNLWVEVIKRIKNVQGLRGDEQFEKVALQLFNQYSEMIVDEFPSIYCELIVYYMMNGIVNPGVEDIAGLVIKKVTDPEYEFNLEVKSSFFQILLIFTELHIEQFLLPQPLLTLLFKQLQTLIDYGTTITTNTYRSCLVSIVNLAITQHYQIFSSIMSKVAPNWVYTWLENSKFISSQYAFKLNALALTLMLPRIPEDLLVDNLNNVFRSCVFHLNRVEVREMGETDEERKGRIVVRRQILETDLKGIFQEKVKEMTKGKAVISQQYLMETLENTTVNRLREIFQN